MINELTFWLCGRRFTATFPDEYEARQAAEAILDGLRIGVDITLVDGGGDACALSDAPDMSLQPCGHPIRHISQGGEGTSYCVLCEARTEPGAEKKREEQKVINDTVQKLCGSLVGAVEELNSRVKRLESFLKEQ